MGRHQPQQDRQRQAEQQQSGDHATIALDLAWADLRGVVEQDERQRHLGHQAHPDQAVRAVGGREEAERGASRDERQRGADQVPAKDPGEGREDHDEATEHQDRHQLAGGDAWHVTRGGYPRRAHARCDPDPGLMPDHVVSSRPGPPSPVRSRARGPRRRPPRRPGGSGPRR